MKVLRMSIVFLFITISYLTYSLTKNFYNNYKVDKYIEEFEAENEALKLENEQKLNDYLYYTSEEYIDKIAKQNLGLVNPGERVIILTNDISEDEDFVEEEIAKQSEKSNPVLWWEFFFG